MFVLAVGIRAGRCNECGLSEEILRALCVKAFKQLIQVRQ